MSITERLKGTQDMKKLQAEIKESRHRGRKDRCRWNPFKRKQHIDDRVVGGGEEEHGASIGRVCSNDPRGDHNASIRSAHREGRAGPGKRKGTCKQVPQPSRGLSKECALPRWLGMSHMSVLGACWVHANFEEKSIFGK
jgi:hypothetical protein